MSDDLSLERKLRKKLASCGYALEKGHPPIVSTDLGGYMIVDNSNHAVVAGSSFELSLEEVAEWLEYLDQ